MRELLSAVTLGLVVTGCTAAEPAGPPPPPPPPAPTRQLVEWSTTVCTQVTALEKATVPSSGADPTARSTVDGVLKALTRLKPSGLAAADEHVAGLVKALEALRPQLPATTAPEADAEARKKEAADVMSGLGPVRQQLAGVVENTPELRTSYNLTPACEPVHAEALPDPAPTRDRVVWADTMCATTTSITELSTDTADITGDDPRFAAFELESYVRTTRAAIEDGAADLAGLSPTRVQEADAFRDTLVTALREQVGKLPEDRPLGDRRPPAQDEIDLVVATVSAIKPKVEGLPAAVGHDQALAQSYDLAPSCVPRDAAASPKPPLTARNGTDIAACQAGPCQVLISGKTDITVGEVTVTVSVRGGRIILATPSIRMSIGANGTGKIGTGNGPGVVFEPVEVQGSTAVVDIRTE
jgi:hypothetical protein